MQRLRILIGAVAACLLAGMGGGVGAARAGDPYRVAVVQTSADLTQRLTPLRPLEFGSRRVAAGEPVIRVDAGPGMRRQVIRGFGAAMTDSSAWLIERRISPAARQRLMAELFGRAGARLDFVKVPIGASDFSHTGQPYSYDDRPAGQSDPGLVHFSIGHDRAAILPALRQARALNPAIRFLATPWSPPGWMKANDSLANANGRGTLLPADYGAYARYIVRFLRAYGRAGIPIGALTLQNEPGVWTLYPGLSIGPTQAATWLLRYLRPALSRAGLRPAVYGGDLGWGTSTAYQRATIAGPAARGLAGLAWHCYYGSPDVMSRFHRADPRLDAIVDECSPGISPTPLSEVVIASLRNWASSVSLWNLALDPTGGPAELPNHGCAGCSGLVTIDPATGRVSLDAALYDAGQASAFIAPGARRLVTRSFVRYRYPGPGVNVASPGLDDVAARNPDGSLVLMAYDNSRRPVRFAVAWRGRALSYRLAPGATVTLVWNRR